MRAGGQSRGGGCKGGVEEESEQDLYGEPSHGDRNPENCSSSPHSPAEGLSGWQQFSLTSVTRSTDSPEANFIGCSCSKSSTVGQREHLLDSGVVFGWGPFAFHSQPTHPTRESGTSIPTANR